MSNANEAVVNITEADRATARRVIRRHVGADTKARVQLTGRDRAAKIAPSYFWPIGSSHLIAAAVIVGRPTFAAAVEAAAAGRAYAAALRGAK